MNRHDGVFHFRYWTSKTDHYTKSYQFYSLGGPLIRRTDFITYQIGQKTVVFGLFFLLKNLIFLAQNALFGAGGAAAEEQGPNMPNFVFKAQLIGLHLRYANNRGPADPLRL